MPVITKVVTVQWNPGCAKESRSPCKSSSLKTTRLAQALAHILAENRLRRIPRRGLRFVYAECGERREHCRRDASQTDGPPRWPSSRPQHQRSGAAFSGASTAALPVVERTRPTRSPASTAASSTIALAVVEIMTRRKPPQPSRLASRNRPERVRLTPCSHCAPTPAPQIRAPPLPTRRRSATAPPRREVRLFEKLAATRRPRAEPEIDHALLRSAASYRIFQ